MNMLVARKKRLLEKSPSAYAGVPFWIRALTGFMVCVPLLWLIGFYLFFVFVRVAYGEWPSDAFDRFEIETFGIDQWLIWTLIFVPFSAIGGLVLRATTDPYWKRRIAFDFLPSAVLAGCLLKDPFGLAEWFFFYS